MCEAIAAQGIAAVGWATRVIDQPAGEFSKAMLSTLLQQIKEGRRPLSFSAGFEEGKKAILSMHRPGSGTEKYELLDPSFDANGRLQRLPGGRLAAGVPMLLAPLPRERLDGVPPIPETYEHRSLLEEAHHVIGSHQLRRHTSAHAVVVSYRAWNSRICWPLQTPMLFARTSVH